MLSGPVGLGRDIAANALQMVIRPVVTAVGGQPRLAAHEARGLLRTLPSHIKSIARIAMQSEQQEYQAAFREGVKALPAGQQKVVKAVAKVPDTVIQIRNLADRFYYERGVAASLSKEAARRGVSVDDVVNELAVMGPSRRKLAMDKYIKAGRDSIFQEGPGAAVSGGLSAAARPIGMEQPLRIALPFRKTPINVAWEGLRYATPLPLAVDIGQKAGPEALRAGAAKMAIGAVTIGTFAEAIDKGAIQITPKYDGKKPHVTAMLRSQGLDHNMLVVGGKGFAMDRLGPVGQLFISARDMKEAGGPTALKGWGKEAQSALGGLFNVWGPLSDISDAIAEDDAPTLERYLVQLGKSFKPAIVNQIQQAYTGELPAVPKTGLPRMDVFGKDIEISAAESLLPFRQQKSNRLVEELAKQGVKIETPRSDLDDPLDKTGLKIELSLQEQEAIMRMRGEVVEKALTMLMDSQNYSRSTNKAFLLKQAIENAHSVATYRAKA